MTEPERVEVGLPELDRTDDPRGGAAAWALLAVAAAMVGGVTLSVLQVIG